MKKVLFFLLLISQSIFSQTPQTTRNVAGFGAGFSSNDMHSSAIIESRSTTKGFLFPRMTTTQRNAIVSPATSLVIFNTTTGAYNYYDGDSWEVFGGGGGGSQDLNDTTLLGNFTEQDIQFNAGAGLNFFDGTNTLNLMQNTLTGSRNVGLPNASGTLLVTVNGESSSTSGNVIQDVQDILTAGNESTTQDLKFRKDVDEYFNINRTLQRLELWNTTLDPLSPTTFLNNGFLYITTGGADRMSIYSDNILFQSTFNNTLFYHNKMNINGVEYLYPNTATSRIATLLDIPSVTPDDLETTLNQGNTATDLPIILGNTVNDVVATFDSQELFFEDINTLNYGSINMNRVAIWNEPLLSGVDFQHDRIRRIKGGFQTDLIFTNPSVNREIVFQDEDGVVAHLADVDLKVTANGAITGATKTKITYDSKGLVTAGADITASDMPSSIGVVKLADGSVTDTEFQYINTLSSNAQTQLDSKEVKSLSAYSFKANNTASTANGTEFTYRHSGLTAYTDTPTFSATTAPSGTENKTYNWQQIGNRVIVTFNIDYSTVGTAVTQIQIPMPSDLPNPVVPTGFSGANIILYVGSGYAATSLTANAANASDMPCFIRRNSSDTDFEFVGSFGSAGYRTFRLTIEYPIN